MSARSRPPRRPTRGATEPNGRPRGRPAVISKDRLLEIAREVFLERGIRATSAEVARRAGIAEGTIFNRFKSKDALFRAAMRFDPDSIPAFVETLAGQVGRADLRGTLIDFASRMLELGRVALPVLMMSWSNSAGDYSLEKSLERAKAYRRGLSAVCEFFAAEMAAGRLKRGDPELLARVFMGSLHHYCMTELFGVRMGPTPLSPSAFASGMVDLLLGAAGNGPTTRTVARRKARAASQ